MSVNGNFLLVIQPPSSAAPNDRPLPALADITAGWPGSESHRQVHHHQSLLPDGHRFDLQWQGEGWHYIGDAQVGAMGMSNGPRGDDLDGVLHAWLQSREMPVERCRGRFLLVCWDIPNGMVNVVTDTFKTWPVCFSHSTSQGFAACCWPRGCSARHCRTRASTTT